MNPIGVLCLQGDYREHLQILRLLGVQAKKVRAPQDLTGISGLIVPGGESTVIDKLSRTFELRDPIIRMIEKGFPVFGTCAGLILLSNQIIDSSPTQQTFGGLDVVVQRNAFGSQLDSFEEQVEFVGIARPVHVAFIRAPLVTKVGTDVSVLARLKNGQIVGVRQAHILGISFHPELTGDTSIHEYFMNMCREANFSSNN